MRFKKLDLNLLVALDALMTEQSITKAAEKLNLSQSACSSALARLRDHFEDELLVQVGRQMELTPRALMLREPVRDVLLRIDTSISALPEFDCTATDREFTLSVSDYSMETLLPFAFELATRQRSKASFKLLPQTGSPARALERGEADLLIIPKSYCSTEHPTEMLFDDGYQCVVWNQSLHARRPLTFERYAAANHVVMVPSVDGAQPAYEHWFMQRYGLSRHIGITTYSFAAQPFLVVGTELIATVHEALARRVLPALPVTLHPVPVPMPPLEQAMQWHKYKSMDPGLVWLRELMIAAARRLADQTQSLAAAQSAPGRDASGPA